MIIDLLAIWKGPVLKEKLQRRAAIDDRMQFNIDLPKNAKTVFISNRKTLSPLLSYDDLPAVILTEDEQAITQKVSKELSEQAPPHNYDGDHILISGLLYDNETNVIYIEAKKAKYSLLLCLNRQKFAKDSPVMQQDLYGTGALDCLITNDGYTVLLQSSKGDKTNYYTVAGHIQAKENNRLLYYPPDSTLVEQTAREEIFEELLWDHTELPRCNISDQLHVSSLLFRKSDKGIGYVEFLIPIHLECDRQELSDIICSNTAPDGHEHTGEYKLINLRPEKRFNYYEMWAKDVPGWRGSYSRVVCEAARAYNYFTYGDATQQIMPESTGTAIPVSFLEFSIRRNPFKSICLAQREEREEEIYSTNLSRE